jgi:hypothetical protein
MLNLHLILTTVVTMLRTRIAPLRADGERGAGGNTLEILLLAIGGVVVAGIVVAVVLNSVNNRTAQLDPKNP